MRRRRLWGNSRLARAVAGANDRDVETDDLMLVELARSLRALDYRFTTVTPATHERILRRGHRAADLRDVFGWSRAFGDGVVPAPLEAMMARAGVLEHGPDGLATARVRVSTLDDSWLVHSPFPTVARDAVFFGPDTYRFVRLLERELADRTFETAVDIGCGTGAAALWLARHRRARRVIASDINVRALRLARVNAAINDLPIEVVASDLFAAVPPVDLAVMNPPYLVDTQRRAYRDGGGPLGLELALRFVADGLAALRPGGRLILYTGVPIIGGRDPLRAALAPLFGEPSVHARYQELEPDVFGEELAEDAYHLVERIAAVALVVDRRSESEVA